MTKHNSNHKIKQVTLLGEAVEFFVFNFVGIVPLTVVQLTKHQRQARFIELNKEQIEDSYNFTEKRKLM
jgi:hypothetical protein